MSLASSKKQDDLLGGYKLSTLLGKGASCKVYKATKNKKTFALKVVRGGLYEDIFNNEVKILKAIKKVDYVLKYEDSNIDNGDDGRLLATELLAGGELREYMDSEKWKKLSIDKKREEVQRIIAIICRVMKVLNKKQIAHRDLKPENIMFKDKKRKEVKIVDFGFAQKVNKKSKKKDEKALLRPKGTHATMAPEVLRNVVGKFEEYDFNCDVWSVGVIAYEMLTGKKPYKVGKTDKEWKALLEKKDFGIKWNSKALDKKDVAFLKLCLEVDPTKRPSFEALFQSKAGKAWFSKIKSKAFNDEDSEEFD